MNKQILLFISQVEPSLVPLPDTSTGLVAVDVDDVADEVVADNVSVASLLKALEATQQRLTKV